MSSIYIYIFFFFYSWVCSAVHILFIEHMLEKVRVLREAFSEASSHAMSGKPSIVFIDEIDALCPRRDFRYGDDVKENFDVSLPHHLIFRLIRR